MATTAMAMPPRRRCWLALAAMLSVFATGQATLPALQVTSGSSFCEIDSNGCVTDGTGAHGNNEACTIRVNSAGTLTATHFDTERGYDYVTIGGTQYEGSTGPSNVAVAAGSTFSWRSDGSVTNTGWVICHALPALQVTSGSSFCEIDSNGCVTDGTGAHGNNEACTIRVNSAGTLTATHFDTERGYDYVTIGGTQYEGSTGPSNVAVAAGSTFSWRSDGSVTNTGWTICLTVPPCNGQDGLCEKRYGEVTFPATHNSFAVSCGGEHGMNYVDHCHWVDVFISWITFGRLATTSNHRQGLDQQWDAGFRGFLVDAHYSDRDVKFCHSNCDWGQVDALKWLQHLKQRMDEDPRDVVTLVFESYVDSADLRRVLERAGLADMIDFDASGSQVRSKTLASMVAPGGKRLVMLDQDNGDATDTDYSQNTWTLGDKAAFKDEGNCRKLGQYGQAGDSYCNVLNNFMQIHAGTPSVDMSAFANDANNVEKRLRMCWDATGVRPSLISVDHFSEGDVVAAVNAVNRRSSPGDWRGDLSWGGWDDGDLCGLGTTCEQCTNEATYWVSKLMTACGDEPCWGAGTVCGLGTTDSECCNGADCPWYQIGFCTCR